MERGQGLLYSCSRMRSPCSWLVPVVGGSGGGTPGKENVGRRNRLQIVADKQGEIQEVQVSGDLAFIWTKLAVSVTLPGTTESIERAGHTLTVFRRVGGKWLLARDANLLSVVQGSTGNA